MDKLLEGIFFAPCDWQVDDLNPATCEPFDRNWSGLFLSDSNDDQIWNGTSTSGLFSVKCSKGVGDLNQRIADMIRYSQLQGTSLIIGTDRDIDLCTYIEQVLLASPAQTGMRVTDSLYLVHSTSRESWVEIQKDMLLKSPARLSAEGAHCVPIGKTLLGDPDDFASYIHLAPYQSMHVEYVVMSRQRGRMTCDSEGEYTPGVRLYLHTAAMIDAEIIVRDGLHQAKVFDCIDLSKYMVFYVEGFLERSSWTPKGFADFATQKFEEYLKP